VPTRDGKPNATGRSSGRHAGRTGKLLRPPKGEPWVYLPRELIRSDAWRTRGINCVRLIDFLLNEHMSHSGRENGNLVAPYDQLVKWGVPRSEISGAIQEAEARGLIRIRRGGMRASSNQPSRFMLTFFADLQNQQEPTNDWRGRRDDDIRPARLALAQERRNRTAWRKRTREQHAQPIGPDPWPSPDSGSWPGSDATTTPAKNDTRFD